MQSRRYPIDLSARMAVCDANYIRLLKLIPGLTLNSSRLFILPFIAGAGQTRVGLTVEENFRYTSTVALRLTGEGNTAGWYRPPVMLVRLYHDACTAEVTSYQGVATATLEDQALLSPAYTMNEKEEVNILLAEWLSLCLQHGMEDAAFPWLADPDPDQMSCAQES